MSAEAAWRGARIAAFFGAVFLVYGAALPYLPLLLDARGLDATEIGVISSVPLILRLILTPAIAVEADRRADHRGVVLFLSVVALSAVIWLATAHSFVTLLLSVALFQIAMQSTLPLIETIAMSAVTRHGLDYGRMRLVGSGTFIASSLVGGWLIAGGGPSIVAAILVAVTATMVGSAFALPHRQSSGAERTGAQVDWRAIGALASSRTILLFLLAAGAVQSSHAVYYTFGAIHWRAAGLSAAMIGALWSVGVIAEIGLFWWSGAVVSRLRPTRLIAIGAAAAVVRWTLMASDPAPLLLIGLQLLHGLTYGATHLGAMHFIKSTIDERSAGAVQALYATATGGIGMGLATIVAGVGYRQFAGASYLAMAIMALAGLIAALMLARRR